MIKTKGFKILIGEHAKYMTIENTDKTGHVSFIEHTGERYDISESDFIKLAEKLQVEADKMKKAKKKVKVTVSFVDEEETPKKKTTKKPKKLEVR